MCNIELMQNQQGCNTELSTENSFPVKELKSSLHELLLRIQTTCNFSYQA